MYHRLQIIYFALQVIYIYIAYTIYNTWVARSVGWLVGQLVGQSLGRSVGRICIHWCVLVHMIRNPKYEIDYTELISAGQLGKAQGSLPCVRPVSAVHPSFARHPSAVCHPSAVRPLSMTPSVTPTWFPEPQDEFAVSLIKSVSTTDWAQRGMI